MMCHYVIKACINKCKIVWTAQTLLFPLELLNWSSHLSSTRKHLFFSHLPKWNFFVFLIENPVSAMPKYDISVSFATTRGDWTTDLQHSNRDLRHVQIKGIKTKVRQKGKAVRSGADTGTHHTPSWPLCLCGRVASCTPHCWLPTFPIHLLSPSTSQMATFPSWCRWAGSLLLSPSLLLFIPLIA